MSWRRATPFFFYAACSAGLSIAGALTENRGVASYAALGMIGLVSWVFLEYALHRFVFHFEATSEPAQSLLYSMHGAHHDDPTAIEHLFARLSMSLPIATAYYLIVWLILGNWRPSAYMFTGLIIGYFTYEWLHYRAHHAAPRFRVFKYLKRYHMLHHHLTPDRRFGVTSPIADALLGTFQRVSRR